MDGFLVGTLYALLQLDDKLSPALTTAEQNVAQFGDTTATTGDAIAGNLTPALADAAVAQSTLATKTDEAALATAGVGAAAAQAVPEVNFLTQSLAFLRGALGVALDFAPLALAITGAAVAVAGLVDGLTAEGSLAALLSDLQIIMVGLAASMAVGIVVIFRETAEALYALGEAVGSTIRVFSDLSPVLNAITTPMSLLRDAVGGVAGFFRDQLYPSARLTEDQLAGMPGVVDGVTIAMVDAADAQEVLTDATGLYYDQARDMPGIVQGITIATLDAAKATKELSFEQQAALDAGNITRDLYNDYGEQLLYADAAAMKLSASIRELASANLLLAPSIEDNSASQDAYNLIGTNSVLVMGEQQKANAEFEASLAAAGMGVMDFSAHIDNQASQLVEYTKTVEMVGFMWFEVSASIAQAIFDWGNVAYEVFSQVDADWAQTAARITDTALNVMARLAEGDWIGAIAAGVSGLGGAIADAISQSAGEDIVERVAYDLGVSITEELGNAIAETAEQLFGGDRNAAEVFHLTDLIDAAGGLNAINLEPFTGQLREVFVMLDTEMFDASHAVTVLQENWETFVEAGIDGAGRLSPALVEIMDLTQHFAETLGSPELATQFLDQWLVLVEELDLGIRENFALTMNGMFDMFGLVAEGLLTAQQAADALDQTWDTFVEEGTNKVTGLLDPALQAAVQTMRQLGIESEAVTAYIATQLSGVVDGLNQRVAVFGDVVTASLEDGIGSSERFGFVLEQLQTDAAGLEQEFGILGVYTVATFGALISEGATLRDALGQIGDSLDALAQGEHVLGLEGSATVDQLLRFREIVTENEAVMQSIDGIQQMMTGLANTGYLTQEVFAAFGTDLTAQFNRLINDGTAANDALLLMQPSLQTLWELQHQFGFEVDASTQSLLDQAESAGLIGAAFQDVMEQIRDILLAIGEALGAELPQYFDTLSDGYSSTLTNMEQQTADSVEAINAEWANLAIDPFTGEAYAPFNPAGSIYTGGYPAGDPRNPFPTTGTYPTGTMTGGCPCVQIGPIYVMDGTAPSVGHMFLDALWAEIQNGGGMEKFRELLCEARC